MMSLIPGVSAGVAGALAWDMCTNVICGGLDVSNSDAVVSCDI